MHRLLRLLSKSSNSSDSPASRRNKNIAATTTSSRLCLLDLPTELILTIISYLPYENAVSFSLTCKVLYEMIFHIYKPTPKHHGREIRLLRLLERDLPAYLSCPIHERLYAWRPRKPRRYQCPQCTSSKRASSTKSITICNRGCKPYSFYGIFEPERRLILRYALLGPDYGISHRVLDHVCKRAASPWANEVTPKIVNSNLMLWRTQHITVPTDTKTFAELHPLISYYSAAICLHSELWIPLILSESVRHARCYRGDAGLGQNSRNLHDMEVRWSCPVVFKCRACATDIRLNMDQTQPNNVTVRFDSYQDLGGLQDLSTQQQRVFDSSHAVHFNPRDDWTKTRRKRLEDDLQSLYQHGIEGAIHANRDHDSSQYYLSDVDSHGYVTACKNIEHASTEPTSTMFFVEAGQVVPLQVSGIPPESRQMVMLDQWVYGPTNTGEIRLNYNSDPLVDDIYQLENHSLPFRMVLDGPKKHK